MKKILLISLLALSTQVVAGPRVLCMWSDGSVDRYPALEVESAYTSHMGTTVKLATGDVVEYSPAVQCSIKKGN